MTELMHYANEPVTFDPDRKYTQDEHLLNVTGNNRCDKCGRFSTEQKCPKCKEKIRAASAMLLDALSDHSLICRSNVFDVCKCGWKGYPYDDHRSLILYTFMLRNSEWRI